MKTLNLNFKNVLTVFFVFALVLISNEASAQGTAKLQQAYDWTKAIAYCVLAIATLIAVVLGIIALFFNPQRAKLAWGCIFGALILWAVWGSFAEEILSKFGGTHINF